MLTALIILNYNNVSDTLNCLESVRKHNTAPIKVIVVDNASSPEHRCELESAMAHFCGDDLWIGKAEEAPLSSAAIGAKYALLLSDDNGGYARGNNLGLELAYADDEVSDVMILNNDILFVEDIIPKLLAERDSLPDCAIVSPVLYKKNLEGYDVNCARRRKAVKGIIRDNFMFYINKLRGKASQGAIFVDEASFPKSGAVPIDLPSGSCMLLRKDVFKRLGSFDPHTFLYYEEDILGEKIRALGMKNYLVSGAKCVHLGAATIKKTRMTCSTMKRHLESQRYYVAHYAGANAAEKALHWLSVRFFLLSFWVQQKSGIKLRQ